MSLAPPVEIDAETGEVVEYTPEAKPARYRAKLDTLADIRREMAKLYRESRSGLLSVQDMTKYVWALKAMGEVISEADIEAKLDYLEQQLLPKGDGNNE